MVVTRAPTQSRRCQPLRTLAYGGRGTRTRLTSWRPSNAYGQQLLCRARTRPNSRQSFNSWWTTRRGNLSKAFTLKQYFRVLKMRYKDLTGNDLDREQVIDVNNAFLMIIHVSSGLRPSSMTRTRATRQASDKERRSSDCNAEDDSGEEDGENSSMDDAVSKLLSRSAVVRHTYQEWDPIPGPAKISSLRRGDAKGTTWPDQDDVLTFPVSHLLALALHDSAFAAGINSAADFFKIGFQTATTCCHSRGAAKSSTSLSCEKHPT
ncbi:hypothetical protein M409DRAFT_61406 [Zasmidium cellare ATCC 36951]|uniref:Uncharacterized protein n=1 Tax=Zasmidium cellare ATCC 36951 TaxID=1080233 RepID=A0A6A6BYZ5_ZASCE|nr:uncharacterized protein M409DRAFT_61406 [Zasmidium cellare ATCC 36951]KAF2158749.1 hypothetical protein M409DRAFT_61406 [Zasmidium cellare ATCC 36951]